MLIPNKKVMELNSLRLAKINPKPVIFLILTLVASALLGLSLEWLFAGGFSLDLALWVRFVPVVVSYILLIPLLTVFAITSTRFERIVGYVFNALAFGLVFLLPPHSAHVQGWFSLPLAAVYLLGLLALDYSARRAVRIFSVFASWMFGTAFGRFFKAFALIIGFLVYFSSQVPANVQFKIPSEVLDPALTLIVNNVSDQILGSYLPFLPLVAAVGAALSLIFLLPIFGWLTMGTFALFYRVLIWTRFAELVEEPRQVPVFKIR